MLGITGAVTESDSTTQKTLPLLHLHWLLLPAHTDAGDHRRCDRVRLNDTEDVATVALALVAPPRPLHKPGLSLLPCQAQPVDAAVVCREADLQRDFATSTLVAASSAL